MLRCDVLEWRAFGGSESYVEMIRLRHRRGSVVHPLESYVRGVVPAESPASWGVNGEAALQAQAVAARSYGLAYLRRVVHHLRQPGLPDVHR